MRKIDRILLTVLFVALFARLGEQMLFNSEGATLRNPLVVQAALDVQPQAIPISLNDSFIEPSPPKANSRYTGSAFALSRDGHWATATHVTDGCKRLDLLQETSNGKFRRVPVSGWRALKDKDVSIMDSAQGEPGLVLASNLAQVNDVGYFFGYPKGKASAGYAVNLGRSRMVRQNGRARIKEISDEWAIYEMLPGKKIALGGNSGGPMLNAQGEVVGVVSAGSDRRGRVNTSIVPSLEPLRRFSKPEQQLNQPLTRKNYVAYGQALRRAGLVSKVDCRT
ncbi:serine protease [Magnetovibrio sp.]|uniref:S1 family peptidase n=1 Tax=Magnetovibrio sp. TaxID=2024836 RepID=UPI002F93BA97